MDYLQKKNSLITNYIIGVLQRCGESWQYKSIFKGLDNIDLEKELKSYL